MGFIVAVDGLVGSSKEIITKRIEKRSGIN
jgi:hypothetical protein